MFGRFIGRHPSPYFHQLDKTLVRFGKGDNFTTRDAAEGVLILGGVGSGKSSGSGNTLRTSYLRAGFGGLVLCAKTDEADSWREALEREGRVDDAIFIDERAYETFNILDYASVTIAADGFDQNLVTLMERLSEAFSVAGADSGSDGNKFFSDAALKWLSHAFPLVRVATGRVSLQSVYDMILSAPKSAQQAKDGKWQRDSVCNQILNAVGLKIMKAQDPREKAEAERVFDEHADFWLTEFPNLAEKTRSSIEATVTNLIYSLLAGKMKELFTKDTTVVPEMARGGKIIILDLPALKYGKISTAAQTIFRYLFGLSMQRQKVSKHTRPVFIWMDEVQYFLTTDLLELVSTARSSKTCVVAITQDLPSFYAQLGYQNKAIADSIISKFGTKIFHSNTSEETNRAAAEMVGKVHHEEKSVSLSSGQNSGGSVNIGSHDSGQGGGSGFNQNMTSSISKRYDYELPPHFFSTGLRTGADINKRKVDGIMVRSGAKYKRTGKHWMQATFKQ